MRCIENHSIFTGNECKFSCACFASRFIPIIYLRFDKNKLIERIRIILSNPFEFVFSPFSPSFTHWLWHVIIVKNLNAVFKVCFCISLKFFWSSHCLPLHYHYRFLCNLSLWWNQKVIVWWSEMEIKSST